MNARSGSNLAAAAALGLAAVLAGCGSILKSDAPAEQVYLLHAAPAPAAPAAPLAATIRVLRPSPQPGLDTSRIALTRPGNRLDYYAGSRWAGPLGDVLGGLLTQQLRASGTFAGVDGDRAGFGPDFVVGITIRRFEAEYRDEDSPPLVRVTLECTLGNRDTRETVANFDADVSVQAAANRLGSVVAALEQAAQQALTEVIARSAAAAGADLTKTAAANSAATADVEAATGAWISAFNRKSTTDIVALYARDAVFFGTSSPLLRDSPELVQDYFKGLADLGNATIATGDHRVQVFGDVAISSGFYTRSSTQNGKTVQNPARFTFVYQRRDGKWMIVEHHSSALP